MRYEHDKYKIFVKISLYSLSSLSDVSDVYDLSERFFFAVSLKKF